MRRFYSNCTERHGGCPGVSTNVIILEGEGERRRERERERSGDCVSVGTAYAVEISSWLANQGRAG